MPSLGLSFSALQFPDGITAPWLPSSPSGLKQVRRARSHQRQDGEGTMYAETHTAEETRLGFRKNQGVDMEGLEQALAPWVLLGNLKGLGSWDRVEHQSQPPYISQRRKAKAPRGAGSH